jgi:2'-5' RNA ligase
MMTARWHHERMLPPGKGRLYWHILIGTHSQVRSLASESERRLAAFVGFIPTPHRWLHLTILNVGLTDQMTSAQRDTMIAEAARLLAEVRPIAMTLSRVIYHPEAIAIAAEPVDALAPLLETTRAATRAAIGSDGIVEDGPWTPHVTVAYSNATQSAAPIISAMGRRLPPCEVTIRAISLVNQDGPENRWDWRPIAEVPLGTAIA